MEWHYNELFPGAGTGNTDPEVWPPLTGASVPDAGEMDGVKRNGGWRLPLFGEATSAVAEVLGVVSNDREHHLELDGHKDSALANHHDGQFAQNTAATSDHSQSANYAAQAALQFHHFETIPGRVDQRHLENQSRHSATASTTQLIADREMRGGTALMVKEASEPISRVRALFADEWSTPAVAVAGLGIYAAARLILT